MWIFLQETAVHSASTSYELLYTDLRNVVFFLVRMIIEH